MRMNRAVEIRSYRLHPGRRDDFHRLVVRDSLPMLQRWGVDVVAAGPSLDGDDDYHLIRAYDSVDALRRDQLAFYGSAEWRDGPREAILALIASHTSTVMAMSEADIDRLRRPVRAVPTLYEWVGGIDALRRLTQSFYQRVPADPTLAPVFAHMNPDHARHVAAFLAEVLGGPAEYSRQYGGHANMIRQHLNRHLTHAQRRAWIALLLDTADELALPDDPEFRSALVGYLEWGSRLAVINSQAGAQAVEDAPMPRWGWGETQGPYTPVAATDEGSENSP
jgi:hemoglobin